MEYPNRDRIINDDVTDIPSCENSEELGLTQSNENSFKLFIVILNVHWIKNMINSSQRKSNNRSSNAIIKNKNVSFIIGDSIIKDVKGWELSNERKKTVVKF